jgi:DNA-binding NtrC family response regulator
MEDREPILIVDDDAKVLKTLKLMLDQDESLEVETTDRAEAALDLFRRRRYHLVITDLKMPGLGGLELLKKLAAENSRVPVIILTAYGTVENAVEAMKLGAFDYILKPVSSGELTVRVRKGLDQYRLKAELEGLKEIVGQRHRKSDYIVGTSEKIKNVLTQVSMVAKSDVTVLIRGQSGTGKELIARAIHMESLRKDKPFVVVNCNALPDSLLENELFGHERGSYTGATTDHKGLFEVADGGTLFLDEIGDIPPGIQVKLLRVLQYMEIRKIGGTRTLNVNVRILAATNRDLEKAVGEGRFREDFFYRLNVIPIFLPPLRERREDIMLLAHHFLKIFNDKFSRNVKGFSPAAAQRMLEHEWPGNVRELENKIQRVILMCRNDVIGPGDLFGGEEGEVSVTANTFKQMKKEIVESFEREYIQQMLRLSNGNISRAAKQSGLNRKNFWTLMRHYNIESKRNKS